MTIEGASSGEKDGEHGAGEGARDLLSVAFSLQPDPLGNSGVCPSLRAGARHPQPSRKGRLKGLGQFSWKGCSWVCELKVMLQQGGWNAGRKGHLGTGVSTACPAHHPSTFLTEPGTSGLGLGGLGEPSVQNLTTYLPPPPLIWIDTATLTTSLPGLSWHRH